MCSGCRRLHEEYRKSLMSGSLQFYESKSLKLFFERRTTLVPKSWDSGMVWWGIIFGYPIVHMLFLNWFYCSFYFQFFPYLLGLPTNLEGGAQIQERCKSKRWLIQSVSIFLFVCIRENCNSLSNDGKRESFVGAFNEKVIWSDRMFLCWPGSMCPASHEVILSICFEAYSRANDVPAAYLFHQVCINIPAVTPRIKVHNRYISCFRSCRGWSLTFLPSPKW